jgi:hypothetical protein
LPIDSLDSDEDIESDGEERGMTAASDGIDTYDSSNQQGESDRGEF